MVIAAFCFRMPSDDGGSADSGSCYWMAAGPRVYIRSFRRFKAWVDCWNERSFLDSGPWRTLERLEGSNSKSHRRNDLLGTYRPRWKDPLGRLQSRVDYG